MEPERAKDQGVPTRKEWYLTPDHSPEQRGASEKDTEWREQRAATIRDVTSSLSPTGGGTFGGRDTRRLAIGGREIPTLSSSAVCGADRDRASAATSLAVGVIVHDPLGVCSVAAGAGGPGRRDTFIAVRGRERSWGDR